MKLNITLPTTITGAAARTARTAGEDDDCLPSGPAMHRFLWWKKSAAAESSGKMHTAGLPDSTTLAA
jgi:hypothetical protein